MSLPAAEEPPWLYGSNIPAPTFYKNGNLLLLLAPLPRLPSHFPFVSQLRRSAIHANVSKYVFRCSRWRSNIFAIFSLDGSCIKGVWLGGGAPLSLAGFPSLSARVSTCAWLVSGVSRRCCGAHTIYQGRCRRPTPYRWMSCVSS